MAWHRTKLYCSSATPDTGCEDCIVRPSLQDLTNMQGNGDALQGLILCAVQTFGLEIITNGNGTIVTQALNYWQTLSSNGGGVAVGAIVEVGLGMNLDLRR